MQLEAARKKKFVQSKDAHDGRRHDLEEKEYEDAFRKEIDEQDQRQ